MVDVGAITAVLAMLMMLLDQPFFYQHLERAVYRFCARNSAFTGDCPPRREARPTLVACVPTKAEINGKVAGLEVKREDAVVYFKKCHQKSNSHQIKNIDIR